MRIAFLGSPPFATPVLRRLLASAHRPVAIVTQPDRPRGRGQGIEPGAVALIAREQGVPVMQPASARDPEFIAALRAAGPEALLVASYGEILRGELLALAPRGAFNVHGSLLPRHRGASPVQAAILAGDAETGVCVQRMVRALDAGDLVLSVATPIGPEETAGELAARLAEMGGQAAVDALDLVASGRAVFTPQDHAQATVCRKLTKESGAIDWARPASELARLARAMNPWPLARARRADGGELAVLRARAVNTPLACAPGSLLEIDPRIVVACGAGGREALELLEVQAPGKRPLDAPSFARGARLVRGAAL